MLITDPLFYTCTQLVYFSILVHDCMQQYWIQPLKFLQILECELISSLSPQTDMMIYTHSNCALTDMMSYTHICNYALTDVISYMYSNCAQTDEFYYMYSNCVQTGGMSFIRIVSVHKRTGICYAHGIYLSTNRRDEL